MEFIVIAVVLFVGNVIIKKLDTINQKLDTIIVQTKPEPYYREDIPFSDVEEKVHYRRDDIDFDKYIGDPENE